jgi:hypothetical protein
MYERARVVGYSSEFDPIELSVPSEPKSVFVEYCSILLRECIQTEETEDAERVDADWEEPQRTRENKTAARAMMGTSSGTNRLQPSEQYDVPTSPARMQTQQLRSSRTFSSVSSSSKQDRPRMNSPQPKATSQLFSGKSSSSSSVKTSQQQSSGKAGPTRVIDPSGDTLSESSASSLQKRGIHRLESDDDELSSSKRGSSKKKKQQRAPEDFGDSATAPQIKREEDSDDEDDNSGVAGKGRGYTNSRPFMAAPSKEPVPRKELPARLPVRKVDLYCGHPTLVGEWSP